ncbi:HesA/MoeB/ThiF family protein [Sphingobacterium sp. WM]|uniref:HesA/MoeB/ThiF family protein n=1 Tax=Sphingobacterium sp. WM TaxID=3031802 RepID=UPI00240DF594|nr:HesA/MoeB/ThiF family protein [Sphingobacterium sp. WM]WFB64825.1 HesA/MoeB/ThiF family protein [Sphingobacterium sp. WM]
MESNFGRYHCQIALPGFGNKGQQQLQEAKVLLIGLGGLGCPAAQYLVSAGIGKLALLDDDIISLSNLHRQILYTTEDIGKLKVEIAAKRLSLQNPEATIIPIPERITSDNVIQLIQEYDLIIEGTDNLETKCLINDACVIAGKPLVYGAIYQFEGQVSIFNVKQEDGSYSANYRDVFKNAEETEVPNCREGGVIPSLAGIVGCMQANEALKYLTGIDNLTGKLWLFDASSGSARTIKLKKTDIEINTLKPTTPTVSFEEFNRQRPSFSLIDVRQEDEHQTFNLGGKNIPLDNLESHIQDLSEIKGKILFYCLSGKRSLEAVKRIKSIFPKLEVFSLRNGIQDLKR